MNLEKVREFFFHNRQGRKTSFTFYIGVMVLEKCQKYSFLRRVVAPLK